MDQTQQTKRTSKLSVVKFAENPGTSLLQKKTGASETLMSRFQPQQKFEIENKKGWVQWGEDNLYPQFLNFLYRNEGLHKAIIRGKASYIVGNGTGIKEIDAILPDIAHNIALFEFAVVEYIWSRDGQSIAERSVLSSASCRVSWNPDTFEIDGIFYSRDWTQESKKKGKPEFIPLFNRMNVRGVDESGKEIIKEPKQVCIIFGTPVDDGRYYPETSYSGGIAWIEVSRLVAEFHRNSLENGLFPSMMVTYKGVKEEEQDQVLADLEQNLQGASNTGKFIVNFTDVEGGVEFTPITTNDADKLYQWHKEASADGILQAHGVTTPLMFGIRTATGFGGNSEEMKTGERMFVQNVIVPYQKEIEKYLSKTEGRPITIQQKNPFFDEPAKAGEGTEKTTDVASLALNGAQIESLVNIILQVATGALPVESGKAVVAAGFPMLTAEQIANIFASIVPGATTKEEVLSAVMSAVKKKSELESFIDEFGKDADADWILLDEYEAEDDDDADLFVSTGTARPNSASELDRTIDNVRFYPRFEYAGGQRDNTREFCAKMIASGKLYRKEDIVQMGQRAVNPGFGPNGADTYSVWLHKGGVNCHHYWKKKIYVSASDLGVDVNSPKARAIAEQRAREKGFKPRIQRLVPIRPIDTPTQGRLPK